MNPVAEHTDPPATDHGRRVGVGDRDAVVRQGKEIDTIKQFRHELRDARRVMDAAVRDYRDGRIR